MSHRRVVLLVIAAVLLLPPAVRAQEQGYPFRWSNFRIELSGGWVGVQPGDLDKAVEYENAYLDHYYLDRYAYYESLYGEAYSAQFTYAGGREFLPLRSGTPLGAAVRYQASPTLGLSLGVQYLRGVQTSGVGLDVAIMDERAGSELPGASTARYANDDLSLSVKTWMPYLAANFGWDLLKFLRTDIVIMGGPIFGDLRVWNEHHESVISAGETASSGSRTMELTGSSTSLAVEFGGRLEVKIFPFLHLYGQAGYAFRAFNDIHGLNSIRTATELPEASQSDYALQGPWGVNREDIMTLWGKFSAPILTTEFGANFWKSTFNAFGTAPAEVDMSGLQLVAGLSIRL
jgi:hypothetical protein